MFVIRLCNVSTDMRNLRRPGGVLWNRMMTAPLQRLVCVIRGHEDYLHFEKDRMYLQCVACGYASPGWSMESRRPILRFQTRRAQARNNLVVKKIA